jgi:hypothetical protein
VGDDARPISASHRRLEGPRHVDCRATALSKRELSGSQFCHRTVTADGSEWQCHLATSFAAVYLGCFVVPTLTTRPLMTSDFSVG